VPQVSIIGTVSADDAMSNNLHLGMPPLWSS
jgi:hypothetical protein